MLSLVRNFKAFGEFKLELQSGNAQFGSKSSKFYGWPWKRIGHVFDAASSFTHHVMSIGEFKLKLQPGNAQFGPKSFIFVPCDLEIWPLRLISYPSVNLNFSYIRKRWIRVKIDDVFSRVSLKFDGWHWKTIWHLFYDTASLVHRFTAISEFKLELQSGNAQFGSKSLICCTGWSWNLTDDLEKQQSTSPRLCYIKLCALFCSRWWIQIWVIVNKRPIWLKIDDFFSRATLKSDGWPWKTIVHLSQATSSFMHHFIITCEFKLELQSGNG